MSDAELMSEVRLIVSDWQLGVFSTRHFGAHQAMTKLVALLNKPEEDA